MNALLASEKPVVACIRDNGLSSAYLAATGADKIYAAWMSNVGSIGVTMSYLDYSRQNVANGSNYRPANSKMREIPTKN